MRVRGISTIVFDIGNVLVRWDPDRLVSEQLPGADRPSAIVDAIFRHRDWSDLDLGVLDEDEANLRFAARSGLSLAEVRGLIVASWKSLSPITETVEWLSELRVEDRSLYGLTNMSRGTFAYIRGHHTYWDHFQGVLVSSHVGLLKPDVAIFERLVSTYELDAARTLFFDDSEINVEGARRAGLHARLFRDAAAARDDLRRLEDGRV